MRPPAEVGPAEGVSPPEVGGLESVAPAGEPAPTGAERARFPLFDALRAIAALAVVVTHTAFVSGAVFVSSFKGALAHLNVGVTIFFLISGFLLYRPYVAARDAGRAAPSWRGYARRRFFRIAPAYWVALTALAVFPGLYGVFSDDWWVYYGLLQPYPIYDPVADCVLQAQTCGIAPTWSLSIEVAFYVALPVYAAVVGRLTAYRDPRGGMGADLWILGALAAASLGVRLWAIDEPSVGWLYSTIVTNFSWFAMGMALAILSVVVERRAGGALRLPSPTTLGALSWGAAAALFGLLSFRLLPPTAAPTALSRPQHVLEHLGLGAVAVLVLLPAVLGRGTSGLPGALLGNRVLSWLGKVSYGIFLWHFPIMFHLADEGASAWVPGGPFLSLTLTTLVVTVALAAASFYLVESPLMRWSRGLSAAGTLRSRLRRAPP